MAPITYTDSWRAVTSIDGMAQHINLEHVVRIMPRAGGAQGSILIFADGTTLEVVDGVTPSVVPLDDDGKSPYPSGQDDHVISQVDTAHLRPGSLHDPAPGSKPEEQAAAAHGQTGLSVASAYPYSPSVRPLAPLPLSAVPGVPHLLRKGNKMTTAREETEEIIARIPDPGLLPEVKELALSIADRIDKIEAMIDAISPPAASVGETEERGSQFYPKQEARAKPQGSDAAT